MTNRSRISLAAFGLSLALLITVLLVQVAQAYPSNPLPAQPGFEGGRALSGAAVSYASPTLADLTGDGRLEIIIGGRDGMVYAVDADGTLLWQFDAAGAISTVAPLPSTGTVDSAPAVGDLDGDNSSEVVVTVTGDPGSQNGGVIVLSHDGYLMPGWPQLDVDHTGDGYVDGFYSSPAVGDLDGDGDLEIVAGSWGQRIYAWHHNGGLVAGWPRFTGDSVWSSPVLADLDRDGQLEVISGADGHHFALFCPGGGCLNVYRSDGSMMAGFPKSIDQTIYSSPAIADLDGDGWLDIVVGTGNYYAGKGFAIYAWDRFGNSLPGWPVVTGGYVISVPAVGDIDGDGLPEVVVGCNDGKAYAVNGDGSYVSGWPVTVWDNFGQTSPLFFSSPVLANFDADSAPEVFVNHYCDTVVLDGNGVQLTHSEVFGATGKPTMYMFDAWCLGNTPAIGDIDLDGRLEIVRAGGNDQSNRGGNALLYVWESDRTPATAPWPMFRGNAMHRAVYEPTPAADARIVGHTLPELMSPGQAVEAQITVENTGTDTWTEHALYRLGTLPDDPLAPNARVFLNSGETVAPGQTRTFTVVLHAPATPGYYTTSWRMVREGVTWFGLGASRRIKVGNEPAFYVLSKDGSGPAGGIYSGGLAANLPGPPGYSNWSAVKAFAFLADHKGYQMLGFQGGVWQGGTAQPIGGHELLPEAQEILLRRGGTSYYILDRYGRLTGSYGASPISPAPPTWGSPIARSAALTPDDRGIYVLDGYGNIYTGGSAVPLLPSSLGLGADIAKRVKLTSDGRGYYVLDAYGRVWNGGDASAITPNYAHRVGEDWARDFELTHDEKGYYLLDKEGNIHTGGTAVAPSLNLTPVWAGQDMAVDLSVADSRLAQAPTVTVDNLTFLTTPSQPRSMTVGLRSNGSLMQWSAETNRAWLSASPSSGWIPASITISVDPTGLELGSHEGSVFIYVEGFAQDPLNISVTLHVVENIHHIYFPIVSRRSRSWPGSHIPSALLETQAELVHLATPD